MLREEVGVELSNLRFVGVCEQSLNCPNEAVKEFHHDISSIVSSRNNFFGIIVSFLFLFFPVACVRKTEVEMKAGICLGKMGLLDLVGARGAGVIMKDSDARSVEDAAVREK